MMIYLVIGIILILYLVLVWFLGTLLGLKGAELWILRGGLAFIGVAGAAAYLWYLRKTQAAAAQDAGADGSSGSEVDLILRDAQLRLQASALGRKAALSSLPGILVLGDEGAAKTSNIIASGLAPELLAGQVYHESNVVPTRPANVWFGRGAVIAEAGGKLFGDPGQLSRFFRRLRPGSLGAVVGKQQNAPRAALLCVSCEELTRPGATEGLAATARKLRAALEEAASTFGVRLPVYVLFTKADRIPFFAEYFGNLTNDEAGQVLGATLPAEPGVAAGVYAEREGRRLSDAFHGIYLSLASKRIDFLPREHDASKIPPAYEFPREFQKLRSTIVQFLVDVARPSQLTVGPFLRGFYFSGVRAVMRQEAVAAPQRPASSAPLGSATMAFQVPQASAPQSVTTKKVPQWLFLPHFFADVLLGDREAMGAAGASLKTSRLRRILLGAAAGLALCYLLALTISFFGNRSLQSGVLDAAHGLQTVAPTPQQLASKEDLTKLDALRQEVATLAEYKRDGAPWRLRWGLYGGDDLYVAARRAYFQYFQRLLFSSTQANLLKKLQGVPATPTPTDEYSPVYDALKAYLITTSHHDKSTRMFLTPVLMRAWLDNRTVDAETAALAQKQFDFYAEELKEANPYSSENDTYAVERARKYLAQFAGIERVYQFMITEASRQNPGVNFNQQFPGSAQAVINNKLIPGAFTKAGWGFMQNAIKNADKFFAGEQWVLGSQSATSLDKEQMDQLRNRYKSDFIAQWREFLKATSVLRFAGLKDASKKLSLLSGNQSPLLAVFWVASQNTAVDAEDVKNAFQPVQFVVTPDSKDRYVGANNTQYMNALVAIQTSVEQASNGTGGANDPAIGQVNSQATSAKIVTRQMAQSFRLDNEGQVHATTQKLLEDPIIFVESLVRAMGPAELNAKGAGFCNQFRDLASKYPFQPAASRQATLQEMAAIFQPGQGALWVFYDSALRTYLVKQGSSYAPNSSAGIPLNPAFVSFFNKAAALSESLYPGGGAATQFNYSLKMEPPKGLDRLSLTVGAQTLNSSPGKPGSMNFVWPGASQDVKLVGKFGSGPELAFSQYEGLWAMFQFLGDADRWQTTGSTSHLELVIRQGKAGRALTLPDGSPLSVRFDLEMPANAPIFQKGFLSSLVCVPRVAQ